MLQIEEDFQQLYPSQHGCFTGRWEGIATQLLEKLKREAKKDVAFKLVEELESCNDERLATASTVLFLLPNLLPPKPLGNAARKCKRRKPSTAESRATFIDVVKVGTSLTTYSQNKRQPCQQKGLTDVAAPGACDGGTMFWSHHNFWS